MSINLVLWDEMSMLKCNNLNTEPTKDFQTLNGQNIFYVRLDTFINRGLTVEVLLQNTNAMFSCTEYQKAHLFVPSQQALPGQAIRGTLFTNDIFSTEQYEKTTTGVISMQANIVSKGSESQSHYNL